MSQTKERRRSPRLANKADVNNQMLLNSETMMDNLTRAEGNLTSSRKRNDVLEKTLAKTREQLRGFRWLLSLPEIVDAIRTSVSSSKSEIKMKMEIGQKLFDEAAALDAENAIDISKYPELQNLHRSPVKEKIQLSVSEGSGIVKSKRALGTKLVEQEDAIEIATKALESIEGIMSD